MRHRLGEYLVHAGLVTEEALRRALEEQKRTGDRLGVVLARMKLATEEQIARTLAVQLGFPYVDLDENPPNPAAAALVPRDAALEHLCIPIAADKDVLTLAMADPLLFSVVQDLEFQTGYRIRQVVATGADILRAIQTSYSENPMAALSALAEEPERARPDAGQDTPSHADELVESILKNAVSAGAAAIHIDPVEDRGIVRYRLDGVLTPMQVVTADTHEAIVARLKAMGGLDVRERRLPQDGRLRTPSPDGRTVDLRLTTLPTIAGEKIVLRALERRTSVAALDSLGLSATALEDLHDCLAAPRGLVVIAGPSGSGRTTTFYAALGSLVSEHASIVSVEDPVECEIAGVSQVDAAESIDGTWPGALRTIRQQDADVIGIGELREGDVATLAIDSARSGALVIGVMQGDDAAAAVTALVNEATDPGAVASALVGVVAQRLVRRLCPTCRRSYSPSPDVLRAMGISEAESGSVAFHDGVGCDQCNHTGYRGRVGVFEVLRVGDRIRRLIAARATTPQIRAAAIEAGMVTLAEDAVSKIRSGVTTVAEVARVLGELQEVRTLCAICGTVVDGDFAACPHCGTRLGSPCPHCGRTLRHGWNFCPYCARSAAPAG